MGIAETSRPRPAKLPVQEAAPSDILDNVVAPEGARGERDRAKRERAAIPVSLLLEATRTAGMFQRSALGHLDHHAWLDRVQSDGQRLIDVLSQMGFRPKVEKLDPSVKR
ncbi:hypothetical protein GR702_10750 [Novosphingobium sp. FGD1]|uniref:Uncharacterized protein n=1 Tax=Novosphingobium silvae TaxID=2692619 RepID=A0A7X4K7I3_9SPHN|nr:hypothetical protein [Novosphingobium silvae]MYL98244.1 hypothetical protein [Novosphingobium silvae]